MNISFVYVVFLFMSLFGYEKEDLAAMQDFNMDRYLGIWYCVARSENHFEKDIHYMTLTYSKRADGNVNVEHKGFNTEQENWHYMKSLAVSMRRPYDMKLYSRSPIGTRHKIEYVDTDYSVAIVNNQNKFWILSRTPSISGSQKNYLIDIIESLAPGTSELEYVMQ